MIAAVKGKTIYTKRCSMKFFTRVLLLLIGSMAFLFGVDGYSVYKTKCSHCHVEMMSKEEALKNFKTLKAPPMVEVSNRLKEMIKLGEDDEDVKRELVLTFIRDYIVNPSLDKSMCRMGALDRFDVMPSQKGKLTAEEISAVAEWVYDRYEGTKF